MEPSIEHYNMWRKNIKEYEDMLSVELNKPENQRDKLTIEFCKERISYIRDLLKSKKDDIPAIG